MSLMVGVGPAATNGRRNESAMLTLFCIRRAAVGTAPVFLFLRQRAERTRFGGVERVEFTQGRNLSLKKPMLLGRGSTAKHVAIVAGRVRGVLLVRK